MTTESDTMKKRRTRRVFIEEMENNKLKKYCGEAPINVRLSKLIGESIRSRSNINQLIENIDCDNNYLLDFSNVLFMSRTFSDELYNLLKRHANVVINEETMSKDVYAIYKAVRSGREGKRKRSDNGGEIIVLNTVEEVSDYFSLF